MLSVMLQNPKLRPILRALAVTAIVLPPIGLGASSSRSAQAQTPPTSSCSVNFHQRVKLDQTNSPERFEIHFDSQCQPVITKVPVTAPQFPSTPYNAGSRTATASPAGHASSAAPSSSQQPTGSVQPDVPAASSPAICVAIETLRDMKGIAETEIRNKQQWYWDGTNVLSGTNDTVYAVPTPDGWVVDSVNSTYMGQTAPAPAVEAFGTATFEYVAGLYKHTQEADSYVYGDGNCEGEFYIAGSVPGSGSYVTTDVHIEYGAVGP